MKIIWVEISKFIFSYRIISIYRVFSMIEIVVLAAVVIAEILISVKN
jgi:hypothetical protein